MFRIPQTFALFLFFISVSASAQYNFDEKMRQVANDLTRQLNALRAKKIAITRLDFNGVPNTEIGEYFSKELNFYLTGNTTKKFKVVPVEQYEEAIAEHEAQQRKQATNQANTNQGNQNSYEQQRNNADNNNDGKLSTEELGTAAIVLGTIALFSIKKGPLAGIKMTIEGDIVDNGDFLTVTYRAINKKKEAVANARATFAKTPQMEQLIGTLNRPAASSQISGQMPLPPPGAPAATPTYPANNAPSWKNNNLLFELEGCVQSQQTIECNLQVTVLQENTSLTIYNETVLFDAADQSQFHPSEMIIADQSSTGSYVQKTLIADFTAPVTLRFNNIRKRIDNIAALNIRAVGSQSGYFWTEMKNISVIH